MSVFVMGAQVGKGAGTGGTESGPHALRAAGLIERLRATGHGVRDGGDLPFPQSPSSSARNTRLKAVEEVANWSHLIRQVVRQMDGARVPVLLGGDHSLSLGSATGLAERAKRLGRPFFVLWVDAHPDCHTPATTTSGHLHGTPVAHALGEPGFAPWFDDVVAPVSAENIMLLGIRSIDTAEQELIDRRRLAVHGPADLRANGLSSVLIPFLERVVRENGMLHVSLDADVLDPSVAPGVGTPVDDGLSVAEVGAIMRAVAASGTLTSLDLVEVNPFLDRDHRTAQAMVALAAQALGTAAVEAERRSVAG